jgi:twitching motility protein PilT
MQEFDYVIKGMIENKTITLEDGLAFATNQNNLLLALKGMSASDEFVTMGNGSSNGGGNGSVRGSRPVPGRTGSAPSMLNMIE